MEVDQIRNRIAELEKNQKEIKAAKDAIKQQLENDLEYVQAREEAKTANIKKKQVKDTILNLPENQKYVEEIKNNTQDLSVLKDILSAELLDFYQKSNKEEFLDSEGKIRKFKIGATLVKGAERYDEQGGFGQSIKGE
ncbi:MAG: hypothetical protein WCP91_02575 [Candidatus Berkelbacteria bacterium]